MMFSKQNVYGRDCFYPISNISEKFVSAFPHSAGKRKCLTEHQMLILREMGVDCKIQQEQGQELEKYKGIKHGNNNREDNRL